jgi:hypothetical protein
MNGELSTLIGLLKNPELLTSPIIPWSCPVPSFGNPEKSKVATVGLNPSNREFVDDNGQELDGLNRRFPTLNSLGISNWSEIEQNHVNLILQLCKEYFLRNPYDLWFKKLDYLISGTKMSFYTSSAQACHLDLIPYATSCKWVDLTLKQKSILLEFSVDILGLILRNSSVKLLILNGKTVVENFEKISNVKFEIRQMPKWTLPRKTGGVKGFAYSGVLSVVGNINLESNIAVLGFNHNIQSSYGVTNEVQNAIRNWISISSKSILYES